MNNACLYHKLSRIISATLCQVLFEKHETNCLCSLTNRARYNEYYTLKVRFFNCICCGDVEVIAALASINIRVRTLETTDQK